MASAKLSDDETGGAGSPKGGLRRLFEGLSAAQVIAGALAAVTSMLLSARIGIAGSVIGVAVGSIVSTVSSQMYKQALSASAEKLRAVRDGRGQDSGSESEAAPEPLVESRRVPELRSAAHRTSTPRYGEGDAYADEAVRLSHAKRRAKAKTEKRVLVVSVVSALVAVALTAFAVDVLTVGEGLGAKPVSDEAGNIVLQEPQGKSAPEQAQTPSASDGGSSDAGAAGASGQTGSSASSSDLPANETDSQQGGSASSGQDASGSQKPSGSGADAASGAASQPSSQGGSSSASGSSDTTGAGSSGSSSGSRTGAGQAASGSTDAGGSATVDTGK